MVYVGLACVCVCVRCKPWRSALGQWAGAVRVLACESCAHEFHRLPVTWQSLRARSDCVFAVNIPSDPFVCVSCDVTCTDSDKQRSLIPLKSRQKSNVRPVRTSQAFFVSASSVFCLTGSLLRCWLCDISEGGFLLCLIHLSVLPSVWQGLNYCGEHKGPHPTWFICTDLCSPAECKENISSVSSKTFRHPRSSYIVRWYFHSIVQMYYAGI